MIYSLSSFQFGALHRNIRSIQGAFKIWMSKPYSDKLDLWDELPYPYFLLRCAEIPVFKAVETIALNQKSKA